MMVADELAVLIEQFLGFSRCRAIWGRCIRDPWQIGLVFASY